MSIRLAGIAGIRTTSSAAPKPTPSSSFSDSFVKVDYPSYPVLTPTTSHHTQAAHTSYSDPAGAGGNSGSSYATYGAPQQQQQQQQHAYLSGYQAHGQQDSYGSHQQQQLYSGGSTYSYQQPSQVQPQQQSYAQPAAYQDPTPARASWQELRTDNGQPYYYNASTGITQWEQPAGFV